MRSGRMVWEELLEEPCVYRIREAGERGNAYVILSEGEILMIDPRTPAMLRSIRRLSSGMLSAARKEYVFFTDESLAAGLEDVLQESEAGRERSGQGADGNGDIHAGENAYIRVNGNANADTIRVGNVLLRCIRAEGHAPGLRCLWLAEKGILFSGEAVGCDHLPAVPARDKKVDALGLQIGTVRRIRRLPLRMILPGSGSAAGLDEVPGLSQGTGAAAGGYAADASYEKYAREACTEVLDEMIRQYCIRILEVYQKVPLQGAISLEKLEERIQTGRSGRREEGSTESICRYLCVRKYLHEREEESGQTVFERGSVLLTDWKL